jgi:hypothetical protein
MPRFKSFAAVALVASALYSAPVTAQDSAIVGTWDLVAATQMGEMKSTMTVAEANGAYTVEIADAPPEVGAGGGPEMEFESSISDIAVDGNAITFKRSLTNPQFSVDLSYELTADGDAVSGKAGSDFGDSAITGARAD